MSAYNFKDETGNTYTYLTVLERAVNTKEGRAKWLCQCKCGNTCVVLGKHLRSGNTKSCGCWHKEKAAESNMNRANNLIGQRFNKLVVLEEAGFRAKSSGRSSRLYKCRCDCGNICFVEHVYLSTGDTGSCGCLRSKGENIVSQLLQEKNISFEREYSFKNLIDKIVLRFDFAIFKNNILLFLLEIQGKQHREINNGYYSEDLIIHDKMKKDYCQTNNIVLFSIDYNDKQKEKFIEKINEVLAYYDRL